MENTNQFHGEDDIYIVKDEDEADYNEWYAESLSELTLKDCQYVLGNLVNFMLLPEDTKVEAKDYCTRAKKFWECLAWLRDYIIEETRKNTKEDMLKDFQYLAEKKGWWLMQKMLMNKPEANFEKTLKTYQTFLNLQSAVNEKHKDTWNVVKKLRFTHNGDMEIGYNCPRRHDESAAPIGRPRSENPSQAALRMRKMRKKQA